MATWSDVTRWSPGPLQEAVGAINTAYNKLVACSDDLRDINTPYGWHGQAAGAAANKVNGIIDGLEEHAAEVASLRRGAGDVSDAITGVQNGVKEVEGLARAHHFTLGGDGAVIDGGPPPDTPEEQKHAVTEERKRIATELKDRVQQVLRQAADIDDDFCAVLDRILAGHTIDATSNDNENTSLAAAGNSGDVMGALSVLAPPPPDASPSANAGWWAALSPRQREQVLKHLPQNAADLGRRNGLPGEIRDKANRVVLDQQRGDLQHQRDEIQHKLDGMKESDPRQMNEYHDLEKQRDKLDGKLSDLRRVDEAAHKLGGRQLLVLDTSGEHVKAAVAAGNVDTARNIVTFTGGFGSTVSGDLGDYDRRMDEIRQDADRLSDRYGDGGKSAAVTWMGYDAPQSLDVAFQGKADQGAGALTPFLQGLDASRGEDPARLVALGHSYGSTTTGLALRQDTGVDAAIFAGSPGIGTDNLADLKVPPGQSYLLRNDGDPVAGLGRFGGNPSDLPGMHHLSTHHTDPPSGQPLDTSTGHASVDQYLRPGTTSQHNIAAILANTPGQLTLEDQPGFQYAQRGGR
ncbi:alpha/beta hydrolase [Amycolatopsis samaneae]|uniref:Alpha/beta hydrolase n=1 Tax=Amycolatopsis samaneae TaxID=664691 RepID=A0ABW5GKD5_9PSEU